MEAQVAVKRGIDHAVEAAGSQKKLADALGVKQQAVHKWQSMGYVPLRRAQEVEALFGVERKTLVSPMVLSVLKAW